MQAKIPLVTAVLITGLHPHRRGLALAAVNCFRAQTYPKKELLIINHGKSPMGVEDFHIREVMVEKHPYETIGDLRNMALEMASGEYVIAWDDDDWHGPNRIEMQMDHRSGDCAVVLKRQIRYSFLNDCAFCEEVSVGIPGTILHPRLFPARYPPLRQGSDTAFLQSFPSRRVVDNAPVLYVRFFHGMNLWDEKHVMRHLSQCDRPGTRELSPENNQALETILKRYGEFIEKYVHSDRSPKLRV